MLNYNMLQSPVLLVGNAFFTANYCRFSQNAICTTL